MIFVELNEASLIESEIMLRNLRLTNEVLETKRSIARWLALSLGVINPGESRLSAVAVLDALINFQFVKATDPNYDDLARYINDNWEAMNEKTLRYHLLKLKNMGLIENSKGKFYFKPPSKGNKYDASAWASTLFENEHRQIATKIEDVIRELKSKVQ